MKHLKLNERIAHFYDRSTPLWMNVWGEHMHHGLYPPNRNRSISHREAQIEMIEALLRWGKVKQVDNILDAGCGVGGSSRYLSKKFDAQVTGITLSPIQAQRAKDLSKAERLESFNTFETGDLLQFPFEKKAFDLIWSMESGEHIAQKDEMLQRFLKLLRPGGTLLMATWCIRKTPPTLSSRELHLLNRIYDLFHLPPMISLTEYKKKLTEHNFTNIETADWTDQVTPFWQAVIRSTFSFKSLAGLLQAGLPTIKGAWAMRYMVEGYRRGLIEYGLIRATKPRA